MKKILGVFLTVICIIAPFSVYAEIFDIDEYYPLTPEEVQAGILYDPISSFSYRLQDDGTIKLVRYIQNFHVDIPESIVGIPVSSLGAYAFANTTVSDIFLPDTKIHIDDFAFDVCDATIWIPGQHPTLSIEQDLIQVDNGIKTRVQTWENKQYKYYCELVQR